MGAAIDANIVNVIAADKTTWDNVRAVLKNANGGHYSKDMMKNPNVIAALVSDARTQPVMQNLLNAQGVKLNVAQLNDFITRVGKGADGKLNADMATFLSSALTPDGDGKYVTSFIKAVDVFKQTDTGKAHATEIDALTGSLISAALMGGGA